MSLEEYKRLNTRKAAAIQVGGMRPTNDPLASHFGLTPMALPGEEWPEMNGKPMMFICQLNLTAAPMIPPLMQDIRMVTFFVKSMAGSLRKENGDGWALRTYKSLDGLVPLTAPSKMKRFPRGFECKWDLCDDYPTHDDPDLVVPNGFNNDEVELDNLARTKLGGYPSLIQSEAWWDLKDHAADPKYCMQINSEEKVQLAWGDGGTVYLARGTASGCEGQWFLDWQCY